MGRQRPIDAVNAYQGAENIGPLERAVLGSAMADSEFMETITDHFTRGDFTSAAHQVIWDEMVVLHRNRSLTLELLTSSLLSRGQLENLTRDFSDVGNMDGNAYLRFLASCKSANPDHWVVKLETEITRREGAFVAQSLYVELTNGREDPYALLEEGQRRLEGARKVRTTGGVSMGEILGDLSARMASQVNGTFTPGYTFSALSQWISPFIPFLENEDYWLLAPRPGRGTSYITRAEMGDTAMAGKPCYIINLENSPIQYAIYFLARLTGINSNKLKDATRLNTDERALVRQKIELMKSLPLRIVTMSAPSAVMVSSEIRSLVKAGYKVGVVDYLQLIRNGENNPVTDISITSNTMRATTMSTKQPLLAVAQLSRNIEQRGDDAVTQLSDLKGSGSLEQDATQVVFPEFAWKNPSDDEITAINENHGYRQSGEITAVPIKLNIAKNRNDAIGTTQAFIWDKSTNRFRAR